MTQSQGISEIIGEKRYHIEDQLYTHVVTYKDHSERVWIEHHLNGECILLSLEQITQIPINNIGSALRIEDSLVLVLVARLMEEGLLGQKLPAHPVYLVSGETIPG